MRSRISIGDSGTGFASRPVRAALPWRMPMPVRGDCDNVGSMGEQQLLVLSVAGSSPAR